MKKIILGLVCFLGFIVGGVSFAAGVPQDWLRDAYQQSHRISVNPYSSDIEAEDLFQESNALNVLGPNAGFGLNDNVMVRFARFLMRMTIVIAVGMLIVTGIKVALAFGDSGKLTAALKDAGIVLLGVFLALASVAIIYLATSLMRGTLDYALFN